MLKDFVDCNSENEIKFYNNSNQEGEPFLVLDKEKLIKSCVSGDCFQQRLKENQDYIINKQELENKKILVYFSEAPTPQETALALNKISQNRNVNFGDEFEFIIGGNNESLLLSYDFFPIQMDLVNNNKTTHKSVIFDVGNLDQKGSEFEFLDTNKTVVHNFNSMETELKKYLDKSPHKSNTKTTFNELIDHISNLTNDPDLGYVIYLNIDESNVDLPTNEFGYGFNLESCSRWKKYVENTNYTIESRYQACLSSLEPEKNCSRAGMLNKSYYNYYSPILKQAKQVLEKRE